RPRGARRVRRSTGFARAFDTPYGLCTNTSVDLMTAFTRSPTFRPIPSADVRVMTETISNPLTSMTTSAITSPSLTDLTTPTSWLRALSMTAPAVYEDPTGRCSVPFAAGPAGLRGLPESDGERSDVPVRPSRTHFPPSRIHPLPT